MPIPHRAPRAPPVNEPWACGTCAYWDPINPPNSAGMCRAKAPSITGRNTVGFMQVSDMPNTYWPVTAPDDWCGEWMAIPASATLAAQQEESANA